MQKILMCITLILSFTLILRDYYLKVESTTQIQSVIQEDLKQAEINLEPILSMPSIDFKMAIEQVSNENIQSRLDENKIVSFSTYQKDNYVIFGHYTNVKNLVFNRLNELKKEDKFSIDYLGKQYTYQVNDVGTINRSDYDKLLKEDSILLLTCTKDLNDRVYYYIYADLINRNE